MFFDTTLSIEKLGEKLFISESSLYRITNSMAASLKKYGLQLDKKPCRVIGDDEFFVRCFYTSYFREAYIATEWPFPGNKRDSVNFSRHLATIFDFTLDDNQLIHINYLLNISLVRMSQGFYIDKEPTSEKEIFIFKKLLDSSDELQVLASQYKLLVNEAVIKDLLYTIFIHQNNWYSLEEKLLITREVSDFVKTLRDFFDITLSNDISNKIENTMCYLYVYHQVYPFRNYIIFDNYFYNGNTIKKDYPTLNQVVSLALTKMEKKTNFPWETDYHNVILYWLMVKWNDLPAILSEKKEKAKVLVFSNLGKEHAEFVAKMIRSNFGAKSTTDFYEDSIIFLDETSKETFEAYDILVTDFNTSLLPKEKLVVIDDIPSSDDWGVLRKAINSINKLDPKPFENFDLK